MLKIGRGGELGGYKGSGGQVGSEALEKRCARAHREVPGTVEWSAAGEVAT